MLIGTGFATQEGALGCWFCPEQTPFSRCGNRLILDPGSLTVGEPDRQIRGRSKKFVCCLCTSAVLRASTMCLVCKAQQGALHSPVPQGACGPVSMIHGNVRIWSLLG